MRLSGLSRVIYLLEGDLLGYRKATTRDDKSRTIRSSEASTLAQVYVAFSSPPPLTSSSSSSSRYSILLSAGAQSVRAYFATLLPRDCRDPLSSHVYGIIWVRLGSNQAQPSLLS